MKRKIVIFICLAFTGSLYLFSSYAEKEDIKYDFNPFQLNQFDFSLEEKSREQLDYDQDGELEDILIYTARYYDSDLKCDVVMDQMAVFEKGNSEGLVYSPKQDIADGFQGLITYEIDYGKSFVPFTRIEIERGKVYLNSSIHIVSEDEQEYGDLSQHLKLEIVYSEGKANPFSLKVAEQWELIAVTADDEVAAYGINPGATYQEILLDVEGICYETGLEWHTDYGDASIVRADYDQDGYCETAFVYPCGVTGGTGVYHDGLLMIEQDENGMVFWKDIFPLDMWASDEIDQRIYDLLDWQIDEEKKVVYIWGSSTGKEMLQFPFDHAEFGDAIIKSVFFTGHVECFLENDKIYMECSPALSFEDRVTPYYLDEKILLEVLYQENGTINLK